LSRALLRTFTGAHVLAYRLSRGRIFGSWGRAPILLLTTTGRKSRRERTTPLLYLRDGENMVVVATNDGSPEHPHWFRNLVATPRARLEVIEGALDVEARTATGHERALLWPQLLAIYPDYERDQKRTERELPVVILERRHE
jgi:deazaflavin-dependent oxidoreductase (nitroreductase family)